MAKKEPAKRGRKAVDENETPEMRFVRLGKARLARVVKGIRALGNLGGAGYSSTPKQREKVREILEAETIAALARMEKAKQKSE